MEFIKDIAPLIQMILGGVGTIIIYFLKTILRNQKDIEKKINEDVVLKEHWQDFKEIEDKVNGKLVTREDCQMARHACPNTIKMDTLGINLDKILDELKEIVKKLNESREQISELYGLHGSNKQK